MIRQSMVGIRVIKQCMPADAGRAVVGEGVVPFRLFLQGVRLPQIIQQDFTDQLGRGHSAGTHTHLHPRYSSVADQIPFIGYDIEQLEPPEKSLYCRIIFADLLAGFDGNADSAVSPRRRNS